VRSIANRLDYSGNTYESNPNHYHLAVNFLLGILVPESAGAGTVIDPKLTYGALDLGMAQTLPLLLDG
jgi:hypothetical protein